MGNSGGQRDVVDHQGSKWLDSSTHRTAALVGTCDHRHRPSNTVLVQHDWCVAHVSRRQRSPRHPGVVGFPTSTIGCRLSRDLLVDIRYLLDGEQHLCLPWCVLFTVGGNGDEELFSAALEFFLFRRQVRLVTSLSCCLLIVSWRYSVRRVNENPGNKPVHLASVQFKSRASYELL